MNIMLIIRIHVLLCDLTTAKIITEWKDIHIQYFPPVGSGTPVSRVTLYTAGHLRTAVPHCSHSRAPIVHTAVPRENNEHGCVYLRCRAVCKLPGCVEGHPWVFRLGSRIDPHRHRGVVKVHWRVPWVGGLFSWVVATFTL